MEVYKDVPGYEGQYQISNMGNVYSTPIDGKQPKLLKQEVAICPHTNYRRVTLCKNGETKRFSVHRLVAKLFIDNPENKPVVNHIDNNGENNKVSNLEWCTQKENMVHSHIQGRMIEVYIKGSKAASIANTKIAETRHANFVGKTINNWKVIGTKRTTTGHNLIVTCTKCNDGKEYIRKASDIDNGITKMCKVCSSKKMWETRGLVPLVQSDYPLELVEDLGMLQTTNGRSSRWAIFKCNVCGCNFKTNPSELIRSKTPTTKCKHRKRSII